MPPTASADAGSAPAAAAASPPWSRSRRPHSWSTKRDGRREEFARAKVRGGVLHACAKRPVSVEAIGKLTDDVERELGRLGSSPEVPSPIIGLLVMERLREMDHIAYVRFASVYRNFQDVESFTQEVQSLVSQGDQPLQQDLQAQLALPINGAGDRPRQPRRRVHRR